MECGRIENPWRHSDEKKRNRTEPESQTLSVLVNSSVRGKTGEICSSFPNCRTLIQFRKKLATLWSSEFQKRKRVNCLFTFLKRRNFRRVGVTFFSLTLERLSWCVAPEGSEWSYRSRTRSAQLCLSLERLNQLNCSFQNRITDIARANFHFSIEEKKKSEATPDANNNSALEFPPRESASSSFAHNFSLSKVYVRSFYKTMIM